MAEKEAPEVSFHREVQVICGSVAPKEGTSVVFAENSHCAQDKNNTWWRLIVTNKVRMQHARGGKAAKSSDQGVTWIQVGRCGREGCRKHNT